MMTDMKWCYAEGSRGIECDYTARSTFSIVERRGKSQRLMIVGKDVICKRHYDIIAKIQNKPDFEARQQLRVAGKYTDRHSPLIPPKKWWNDVLLPSYRDESF